MNNWDISFLKNTSVTERFKVQFRAEFLNALNHVTFNNPDTSPTSTAFGTVNSEKTFARRIQLGLKFFY
jgi:hypothetical protein